MDDVELVAGEGDLYRVFDLSAAAFLAARQAAEAQRLVRLCRHLPELVAELESPTDVSGLVADVQRSVRALARCTDTCVTHAREAGLALGPVVQVMARPLPRAIRYVLDRHRLETELQRMAHVDPLTGLRNRRYLMKQLDAAVGAARRHGHPLSVSVCDIDRFKSVNDEHGHLAGDEVLRSFAGIVSQTLRLEDQVARFGGDEFCLMFPHVGADEAARAVERIRMALEDMRIHLPDGSVLSVTATFGIADFDPEVHRSGQDLFESADTALYGGKQHGRNRLSSSRP